MNRRMQKKRDKKITEAINGLVFIAERREQQRQAAIQQMQKTFCGSICRNAEGNRPFTLPSICSVGAIFWNDEKCVFPAEKKGGIDAVTKKKTTCMIRAPTKIPIAHTDN